MHDCKELGQKLNKIDSQKEAPLENEQFNDLELFFRKKIPLGDDRGL